MKKFLVLFTCAENSKSHQLWKKLSSSIKKFREKKGRIAEEKWKEKYRDKIVSESRSLGGITKTVDAQGVFDFPSQMGAFIVVKSKSHDEAAKMFLDHPHFTYFPGDGVDIIEIRDRVDF